MEQIKISIIIPMYNAEKYVSKCLDNILSQTFKNFEVICVNDGSTDETYALLHRYSQLDTRIIVINQENGGVSKARNVGMENANGEYIIFIDVDDYLERNACQKLFEYVEKYDVDILQFQHCNISNNFKIVVSKGNYRNKIYYLYENLKNSFPQDDYIFCWDRIYKKTFLLHNKVSFPLGQKFAEDFLFVIQVYKHNPKIVVVDDYLYKHMINNDSVCHSNTKYEMFYNIKNINLFLEKEILPINRDLFLFCLNTIFYNILRLWKDLYFSEHKREYFSKIQEYINLLEKDSNFSSYRLSKKYLFIEKMKLSKIYWNVVFPIERYFIKFFIKQIILKIKLKTKGL